MKERWLYAWGLGSAAFGGASLLVPLYLVQLGASAVQLGLLAAAAAIGGAPGAIIFGRLADRTEHRRQLIIGTLSVVSVSLVLVPLVSTISLIIVLNAVLWLVVAAVGPVLTMVVVDGIPESAWSTRIGLINKFQGYGWAGGLVLGTVWPAIGAGLLPDAVVVRSLFFLLAALSGASVLWISRSLPRPDRHVTAERNIRKIARLVTESQRGIRTATFMISPNRLYWTTRAIHPYRLYRRFDSGLGIYLFAAAIFFTGFAMFWAPLPLFLTASGFAPEYVFGFYLLSSLGSAVLYERAGILASQYDMPVLQASSLGVRGLLLPTVGVVLGLGSFALEFALTAIVITVIGLTWAVIAVVGTAMVTRMAPSEIRSDVLGVYTALAAIAGGVGSVIGGWIGSYGATAAFGGAGALVLLSAVLIVLQHAARLPGAS